jgi:hypothetical protein
MRVFARRAIAAGRATAGVRPTTAVGLVAADIPE